MHGSILRILMVFSWCSHGVLFVFFSLSSPVSQLPVPPSPGLASVIVRSLAFAHVRQQPAYATSPCATALVPLPAAFPERQRKLLPRWRGAGGYHAGLPHPSERLWGATKGVRGHRPAYLRPGAGHWRRQEESGNPDHRGQRRGAGLHARG